jgi:hypothetical protein
MTRSELKIDYDRSIVDGMPLMYSGDTASLVLYGGDAIKIKWAKNYRKEIGRRYSTFDRAVCELKNRFEGKAILLITLLEENHDGSLDSYRLDIFAMVDAILIKNPPEIIKNGGLVFAEEFK